MENTKIIKLRQKHGIYDSRNQYTEAQIIELSKRRLYFFGSYRDSRTGDIHIEYKKIAGYISEDTEACIFIKDSVLTGSEDNYIPVKKIQNCTKIKEGIYHDEINNVIYCTTEEIQFCIDYYKEKLRNNVQYEINEIEQELLRLKNANIQITELF